MGLVPFQSEDSEGFRKLQAEVERNISRVDDKLALVDKALERNDNHVQNLRELNRSILEEFRNMVEEQFEGQGRINAEIRDEIRDAIQRVMDDLDRRFRTIDGLSKHDVDVLRVKRNNVFF